MMQLFLYLLSAGLVVLGALAFIAALKIPGRFRMMMACLMACVPAVAGVYLFQSSGLKISDWDRLVQSANQEIDQIARGFQGNRTSQAEIMQLLEPR